MAEFQELELHKGEKMIKNIISTEVTIDNRVYRLYCDNDSPIAHVKEALLKFVYYASQLEEQAIAHQKAMEEKAAAEKAAEPPKES